MTFPILPSNSASGADIYGRSLRFNSADGTSLGRTPSSATNRQTFTISFWAKNPSTAGSITTFYAAGSDTNNNETIIGYWDGLYVQNVLSGTSWRIRTAAVYRDPSAWYNLVFAFDLSNGTQANRLKIYVNGIETAYSAADSQPLPTTANSMVNSNVIQYIGRRAFSPTGQTTNAYLAEFYLIDGQALDPSYFGQTNATTGQWQPKAYSGSYGTNGFYLNFKNNSTVSALGTDYSGNGNNWTPNNFSVTAGAGNDSMWDYPANVDDGGNGRGNYCTLNPLDTSLIATTSLTNGNLDASIPYNLGYTNAQSTISVTSGQWYCEVTPTNGVGAMVGICDASVATSNQKNWSSPYYWGYFQSGSKFNNNTPSAYGASFTTNDVIGIALDMNSGSVTFYKNGVSQGVAFNTGISGRTIQISLNNGSGGATQTYTCNFGQRPFAYTPPSGFKALNTQNLPSPTIAKGNTQFNPVLYTGNGSTQSITGVGFRPDFIWLKARSAGYQHGLFDVVRGTGLGLVSNNTIAETAYAAVTSFNTDGFTNGADYNTSAVTYVAWNWKANGAGVTNTAGTITSTVSANTTAGFSVVTYTGTGANATVGHGLGVAPRMVIVKGRSGATGWLTYHVSLGASYYIVLNATDAQAGPASAAWNATSPTSSVFSLGTGTSVNNSTSTYVAYCFAAIPGYSAFGSYTGNGSADGPFVYTGFRPAFVLVKETTTSGDSTTYWCVWDNKRDTYNKETHILIPNLSAEEFNSSEGVDFVSNGFKFRDSTHISRNASGSTYIYAAFAQSPFKYANAR